MASQHRNKIRVLIVDDMESARRLIRSLLQSDPAITVVGEASDGEQAVVLAERLRPDVITMDVLMPVMNGYVATERIMATCPTPIIAITALPLQDGSVFTRMMNAGALDIVAKAFGRDPRASQRMQEELLTKVKAAAQAHVAGRGPTRVTEFVARDVARPRVPIQVVVVAASTGGPQALLEFLRGLSRDLPCPILVVQHIAPGFSQGLANWLNTESALPVRVAYNGEKAEPGYVYLAPDDRHLLITAGGIIRVNRALPVGALRPAGDVLFRSASQAFGRGVLAVVLSGMGSDGAEGARHIKAAGGIVLVQDEETSTIFGMPKAVIEAGAADEVLPLGAIAKRVMALCARKAAS